MKYFTLICGLLLLLSGCSKPAPPPKPNIAKGHFFMFTVNVIYKGEPLEIKYAAGCDFNISMDIGGDVVADGASIAPSVYGVETPDGGALVVKTPIFCKYLRDIDAGNIPSDFNPLIIHYEDAEKPWFGLGYYSAKAFTQPISVMKFVSSKTERISAESFATWRKENAGSNWVTYERMNHNADPFIKMPLAPGRKYMSTKCHGAIFKPLPQVVSDRLNDLWVSYGKPIYWGLNQPDNIRVDTDRYKRIKDGNILNAKFGDHYFWEYGDNGNQVKPIAYPVDTDFQVNNLDETGYIQAPDILTSINRFVKDGEFKRIIVRNRIIKRSDLEGFFYCNSHDDQYLNFNDYDRFFNKAGGVGGLFFLNQHEFQGGRHPHPYYPLSWMAFEETEHIIFYQGVKYTGMGWKL